MIAVYSGQRWQSQNDLL